MNKSNNVNFEAETETAAMQNVLDILESTIYARRIIKAEAELKIRLAVKNGVLN